MEVLTTQSQDQMSMNRRTMVALCLMSNAFLSYANASEERGWFGLTFSVETEGLSLNPIIRSVKIEKVAPSSPGAGAGLVAGDIVVALQGVAVAGARADDLKSTMKKSVGETLRLRVKRGSAEPFEVPLVAIAKPSGR
jgi:C-terminal processing protease CtpA/Prc